MSNNGVDSESMGFRGRARPVLARYKPMANQKVRIFDGSGWNLIVCGGRRLQWCFHG